jgi:hypothetical protein
MTLHAVVIVVAAAGTVILSAISLAIGILRTDDCPEFDLSSDEHGKSKERPWNSPLSY